jgi:hypothetical protein
MVAAGTDLMVVAMDTTFRRPARFDEEVEVVLEVERLGETSLTSAWRVERDGEVLCSGTITHVCIDPGRPGQEAHPRRPARGAGVRTVTATRYVTPLREGGSLPAIVEADDDGLYVVKFRGAGQGPKALAAEIVAGELGRALGLPVPSSSSSTCPPTWRSPSPTRRSRTSSPPRPG